MLWKGDITTLKCECIVNAANETGLGCFTPGHPCIDNAIHRAAGPKLLEECRGLGGVPAGTAKITYAYDLPSKYIIHTTGPRKEGSGEDHKMLAQCYEECLELAKKHDIKEVAFCCISTGMFGFNKQQASCTAFSSVVNWLRHHPIHFCRIIFCVFTDEDYELYKQNLASLPNS